MDLTIQAVGDIGLMGRVRTEVRKQGDSYPFGPVRDTFSRADILFGNLEIPLLPGGYTSRNPLVPDALVSTEDAGEPLRKAGFHVLSLANNHVMDHGVEGLQNTIDTLQRWGIGYVGAGHDLARARLPWIFEHDGRRIGFLAYANSEDSWATADRPGVAPMVDEVVDEDLAQFRSQVDILVLSLHFGLMYTDYPQIADQTRLRRWIDRGANLILGHHPHVIQGLELYQGGLIAYSLGEFVFDPRAGNIVATQFLQLRAQSMILECHWDDEKLTSWNPIPIVIGEDLAPHPVEGPLAEQLAERIASLSAPLGGAGLRDFDVEAHIGERLVGYEIQGLVTHFRKGGLGRLAWMLARIRIRHVRYLLGWIRTRLREVSGKVRPDGWRLGGGSS